MSCYLLRISFQKMKGVVAFYDHHDIPGKNTFTPKEIYFPIEEELFCSNIVKYYSQPIGCVVATSQDIADKASEIIEVTYEESGKKPMLTVRDLLRENATDRIKDGDEVKPTTKGK